ncbi:MAG: hypothetical protein ABEJ55_07855 [Halanaeroarchaeum sp.]
MTDADALETFKRAARRAGRQIEAARREYRRGRAEAEYPTDEAGRVRLVCRIEAARRKVPVVEGEPACFDGDRPACRSCKADLEEGVIETW